MKDNLIQQKSFVFALSIIELSKELKNKHEYNFQKQILRSGTSIGANVEEAIGAVSKKDFINKLGIAYKEARETKYWLRLLHYSNIIEFDFKFYLNEIESIIRILISIIKTSKSNNL